MSSPSETTASFTRHWHFAFASRLLRALSQFGVNEERVAGENRFAEFHVIGADEIADAARALA